MRTRAEWAKRMALLALVMLLVGSCNGGMGTQSPTGTVSPATVSSTRSPTDTPIPTDTYTPQASATPTFTPTVTATASSTPPPPTWTPPPTLAPDEAQALVVELFKHNGGCKLPCWWGFIPGKTKWADAKSFLERFAMLNPLIDQDAPEFDMDILVPVPEDIFHIPLEQIYRVKNGTIINMEVYLGNAPVLPLSAFLTEYGPPGEIWIMTYRTKFRGYSPFLVVLFYPDKGILATFGPKEDYILGDIIQACDMDGTPSDFGLWSPENKMTFLEAATEFRYQPVGHGALYLPIEEATSMDVEAFYETYKIPKNPTCIETPTVLWPEQY
jgi:hypothetical protein